MWDFPKNRIFTKFQNFCKNYENLKFFLQIRKENDEISGRISFSSFGKKFEKKSQKIQNGNFGNILAKIFFQKNFLGANFFFLFLLIVSFLRRL
jgi:hypothetical protein